MELLSRTKRTDLKQAVIITQLLKEWKISLKHCKKRIIKLKLII